VIIIIAIIGFAAMAMSTDSAPSSAENTADTVPSEPLSEPAPATVPPVVLGEEADKPESADLVTVYRDGTYTAVGDYRSPAGPETIDVSITLKDDIIVDAVVDANATNKLSIDFQGKFISGYKAMVIGKRLDEVQLDKVSGSSLTPAGFNEALVEIKADAAV
jgi:hypothetical protein